jgi:hypothetical protein
VKKNKNKTLSRTPRRWLALAAALVVVALFLFLRGRSSNGENTPSEDAVRSASPARSGGPRSPSAQVFDPKHGRPLGVAAPAGDADDQGSRETAERRLERARHTLEGYLHATRYPPTSRPLSEKPDLEKPHSVTTATHPLAGKDGKVTRARVTMEQDRLFLVGDEAARLTVSCLTSEGPARCEVLSAEAGPPPSSPHFGKWPTSPVSFAGDPAVTASFAPADHGFGRYHGPIGVDLRLRIDGEEGSARFDVIYTPAAPARFTGRVREALEGGSVCLYVELAVDKPGRYVIVSRVDDAEGDPFGYLEFNDLLAAGPSEARMCIFGKLVLDERAKAPFTLRDLEGFLLLEDHDPDRELMAAREGAFYKTKEYAEDRFSDADWQSEEKERHVKEFEKDVKEAEAGLEAAGGK